MTHREITLTRDCKVILIPSGEESTLVAGSPVVITQSLGGTYTVATQTGLARVAEADADALGLEVAAAPAVPAPVASGGGGEVKEDDVWAQLKHVYDPEIPVNIVDLGLVYSCDIEPVASDPKKHHVDIKMTLTAPGCGMGDVIKNEVEEKVRLLPTVDSVMVDLVFEPQWDRSMMSDEARLKTGLM